MPRRCVEWLLALSLAVATGVCGPTPPLAPAQDAPLSPDEQRARKALDRFVEILESNPRFGVALDRVYGHHVERGTIDDLTQSYRDRIAADSADGTAWMVLGLIEFHRGRDAEAVEAFREAERHRADDPLASYYLGRALLLVGQTDAAVEAFERAIERAPQRADLLEICQALGRVHQRAHRNEEALAVWNRLEETFPDDLRVQEQIARTLAEEGEHAGALTRYEKLAQQSDDRYEKVQYSLRADEMRLKLGQTEAAVDDMEQLLADLRPESWLYRDVRQRIEEVFLRTDDYAGLAEYYERWLEQHPDDIDAMTRLGEALAVQGRMPEAQEWYARAIERAPSNVTLRLAYIEQLAAEQKYAEAVEQYEQLEEIDPRNPDHIAEWGRLIVEDRSLDEADRHARASEVWKKLLEAHSDDPVIVTQVADLHRHAELNDEAIELYQRAIELAPDDPQYREYLGEFFHRLKRPEDAQATWQAIVAGDNRTTRNLVRLAEVYFGFGYTAKGIETMREACELDPEFGDHLRFAEMLREEGQVDEALSRLAIAAPLAESPDERQTVLGEQIQCYQASGRLSEQIDALAAEIDGSDAPSAEQWQTLALYYEADRNLEAATAAIRQALDVDSDLIAVWTTAARIFEASGQLGDAADANARLTELDRRYRTEYLTEIARLRIRLGQSDEAIQAADDLIAAAPGNPEHYQFYADVCFQLGRPDEGLEALRRSVAVNPADEAALLSLAGALADQFRTDEAIDLYWRAFEQSPDLDGQISIVTRLANLYLRTNHFDRLVTRLETMARNFDRQRDMAICLANAHAAAGDLGSARITLEALITEDSRDVQLLSQLVRLSELEEDYETAVRYQRRINELAPGSEGALRLANLLMNTGEVDEAEIVWMRIAEEATEPHRVYQSIDRLLQGGKYEVAQSMIERLLADNPRDWEALIRSAMALWYLDERAAAAEACRALLEVNEADDAPNALIAHKLKQEQSSGARTASLRSNQYPEVFLRTSAVYEVQQAIGMSEQVIGFSSQRATWSPQSFGQARIGALTILFMQAREQEGLDELTAPYRQAAHANSASGRDLWDWYYLLSVQQYIGDDNHDLRADMYATVRRLSQGLDPDACLIFLQMASNRSYFAASPPAVGDPAADGVPQPEALNDEQLDHLKRCFDIVRSSSDEWTNFPVLHLLQTIVQELNLAGKTEEADAYYEEVINNVTTESDLQAGIQLALQRREYERALEFALRLEQRQVASGSRRQQNPQNYGEDVLYFLAQLMAAHAAEDRPADVLPVLDASLDILRDRLVNRPPSRSPAATARSQGRIEISIPITSVTFSGDPPAAHFDSNRYVQLEYPQPNEFFDYGGLIALRNAYEIYNEKDILIRLVNHLQQTAEDGDSGAALFARLALVYIYWWHDLKQDAADQMEDVVAAEPGNLPLRLELALMLQHQGETERALEVIDEVDPLNHELLLQREMMALQFATATGNRERSRSAGERLFGLRLTTEVQLQLADYLHQAGMHDLAEGLLARARSRAGNRTSSLLSLLQHYQSQGDTETSIEIAFQILRRSSSRSDDDGARQMAVAVLAQSGRLDALITRTKEQLERSSNSLTLHQTLAEYYRAAGDNENLATILKDIAALRPEDARLQFDTAGELIAVDAADAACDLYLAALKVEPALLAYDYRSIQNAFVNAGRTADLVEFFREVDLTRIGQYHYVMELITALLEDDKSRPQGLELFARAWESFPDSRQDFLDNISQDAVWQLSVMYDYASDAVIPEVDVASENPWYGTQNSSILQRLMQSAAAQERFDELIEQVAARQTEQPDWHGGAAVLAVIEAHKGDVDAAATRVEDLMDSLAEKIPLATRYQVGMLLKPYDELTQPLIRWYEEGMHEYEPTNWSWGSGPKHELADLYLKADRRIDARAVWLELWRTQDLSAYYQHNAGYAVYAKISNAMELGQRLTNARFPVDALRIFDEAEPDAAEINSLTQFVSGQYLDQFKDAQRKAAAAIDAEALSEALTLWLTPDSDPQAAAEADSETGDGSPPADSISAHGIDLLLTVTPGSVREARVSSIFEKTMSTLAQDESNFDQIRQKLAAVRKQQPRDVSLAILAALAAFIDADDTEAQQARVRELVRLVEETPLTPLESTDPQTASTESSEWLGLWLVARVAYEQESTRSAAKSLAERALEAARGQPDEKWTLAMLREQAETALDVGDRQLAEQRFLEMLEIVLSPAVAASETPRPKNKFSRRPTQQTIRGGGFF